MPVNRGLYVRNNGNIGTTPIEARLVQASMLTENSPGVPRQGLLGFDQTDAVKSTNTMGYDIYPCTVVINRASGEGVYVVTLTGAAVSKTTTAAPGTGSRYDLIYIKQHDLDKGDAVNTAEVAVLQGTSSTGTPTKPYANLPAGAYVLAEAQIYAGTVATIGGSNTITQVWRHTALRGAPVPVRNAAERAEITTPRDGQVVYRLDRAGAIERYSVAPPASPGTPGWVGGNGLVTAAAGYTGYGSGYGAPAYVVDPDGHTTLSGVLGTSNATISMNAGTLYTVATLPAEARPTVKKIFPAGVGPSLGIGTIYVQTNGDVQFLGSTTFSNLSASNFYISLDGMAW